MRDWTVGEWYVDDIDSSSVSLQRRVDVDNGITVVVCVILDYYKKDRCKLWFHTFDAETEQETQQANIDIDYGVSLTGWNEGRHADEWADWQKAGAR